MGLQGKRRMIYKVLTEPEKKGNTWTRWVNLTCGHDIIQKLGDGPNSSHKKAKFAYCMECLKEEV